MLAAIALVVVLAVGGVTAAVIASSGSSGSSTQVVPKALSAKVGDPAPDFSLTTLDGKQVQLSDFKGTPVVLNFWASWCNPCREEFPLLRKAYSKAGGKWQLVGVNTADLIESDARTFARKAGADWPNAYDPDAGVRDAYSAVRGLPQTVFVDAQGIVRTHLYGPLTQDVLDKQLAQIGAP
jgi:cytochrome c biogenesis protein CcmG/thiol:disulfide interchange protein DsbE